MWNHASAIPAYAVKWIAYHHSYESLRRTITSDVTSTTTSRNVPIVAVMIPGYGDVVGAPRLMLRLGGAEPFGPEQRVVERVTVVVQPVAGAREAPDVDDRRVVP